MNRIIRAGGAAVLVLALAACNLPRPTPTPGPGIPTPNLTMTALFRPGGISGTATPPPLITATPPGEATEPAVTQPAQQVTASVTPSATATEEGGLPVDFRVNARFEAEFLTTPPVLDGVWDEWDTRAYPIRAVVYGSNNRENPEDVEGSFRIGWDRNNLYLAVKVLDDRYVQNATGVMLYQGDSLELQLDTDLEGDLETTTLNDDDFQLGISPGRPDVNGTREAYLWNPPGLAGSKSQVQIAAVQGDGVYRVEIAIPWSLFNLTPAEGDMFGFSLNVSDNDNPNENVQQTMLSAVSGRTLTDPTTWGLLVLVD